MPQVNLISRQVYSVPYRSVSNEVYRLPTVVDPEDERDREDLEPHEREGGWKGSGFRNKPWLGSGWKKHRKYGVTEGDLSGTWFTTNGEDYRISNGHNGQLLWQSSKLKLEGDIGWDGARKTWCMGFSTAEKEGWKKYKLNREQSTPDRLMWSRQKAKPIVWEKSRPKELMPTFQNMPAWQRLQKKKEDKQRRLAERRERRQHVSRVVDLVDDDRPKHDALLIDDPDVEMQMSVDHKLDVARSKAVAAYGLPPGLSEGATSRRRKKRVVTAGPPPNEQNHINPQKPAIIITRKRKRVLTDDMGFPVLDSGPDEKKDNDAIRRDAPTSGLTLNLRSESSSSRPGRRGLTASERAQRRRIRKLIREGRERKEAEQRAALLEQSKDNDSVEENVLGDTIMKTLPEPPVKKTADDMGMKCIRVSGAGSSKVNGKYWKTGFKNGKLCYEKATADGSLRWYKGMGISYWTMSKSVTGGPFFYKNMSNANSRIPPIDGWIMDTTGKLPEPKVEFFIFKGLKMSLDDFNGRWKSDEQNPEADCAGDAIVDIWKSYVTFSNFPGKQAQTITQDRGMWQISTGWHLCQNLSSKNRLVWTKTGRANIVWTRISGGKMGQLKVERRIKPTEQQRMDELMRSTNMSERVETSWGYAITVKDLHTLKEDECLNDEVINAYMKFLQRRAKKLNKKMLYFNTFFYSKICGEDEDTYQYKNVRRWTTPKKLNKLCDVDTIFESKSLTFPVHVVKSHWTLACINFEKRRCEWRDSLQAKPVRYVTFMKRYLRDEWIAKKKEPVPPEELSSKYGLWCPPPKDLPFQSSDADCGVFVCMYARYLQDDSLMDFRQSDITKLRRLMIHDLLFADV